MYGTRRHRQEWRHGSWLRRQRRGNIRQVHVDRAQTGGTAPHRPRARAPQSAVLSPCLPHADSRATTSRRGRASCTAVWPVASTARIAARVQEQFDAFRVAARGRPVQGPPVSVGVELVRGRAVPLEALLELLWLVQRQVNRRGVLMDAIEERLVGLDGGRGRGRGRGGNHPSSRQQQSLSTRYCAKIKER